ncbi:MAG: hypothetical protein IKK45_06210 [Akkermansia sp.]|nr:hypothetical protein [Akkermansia sp.]
MAATDTFCNLQQETEVRWNLVETAWEYGLNAATIGVKYDEDAKLLFVDNCLRRKNITSAKDALNGYQKGRCFYCFRNIDIDTSSPDACDVDHFYPHILKPFIPYANLDGIWNLVLACRHCNRGSNGKFSRVSAVKYVQRLHKRNESLICSHHPLRETLIQQTGNNAETRSCYIRDIDMQAVSYLLHRWETEPVNPAVF